MNGESEILATHRWVDPLCRSTCFEESLDQLVNDLNCTTFRIADKYLYDIVGLWACKCASSAFISQG